jgi:hypothetical protein
MAKLQRRDIEDIIKWFEDALNQLNKIDRQKKMKMRKKIRDEIYFLMTWGKPTPTMVTSRLEERLRDVFKAMPFGLKENFVHLLEKKINRSK